MNTTLDKVYDHLVNKLGCNELLAATITEEVKLATCEFSTPIKSRTELAASNILNSDTLSKAIMNGIHWHRAKVIDSDFWAEIYGELKELNL